MKFEVDKETIQDMIAMFGPEHAIDEITSSFLAALETAITEIFEEKMNG